MKKDNRYFCVCPMCSNLSWIDKIQKGESSTDYESVINSLEKDGELVFANNFYDSLSIVIFEGEELICSECEYSNLVFIRFCDCNKPMRKKIYVMNSEDRIRIAKGFKIMDKL